MKSRSQKSRKYNCLDFLYDSSIKTFFLRLFTVIVLKVNFLTMKSLQIVFFEDVPLLRLVRFRGQLADLDATERQKASGDHVSFGWFGRASGCSYKMIPDMDHLLGSFSSS